MHCPRFPTQLFAVCLLITIPLGLEQILPQCSIDFCEAKDIPQLAIDSVTESKLTQDSSVQKTSTRERLAAIHVNDRRWPEAEILVLEEEHFTAVDVFKRYSLIRVEGLPYLVRVVEKLQLDSESGEEQLLSRVEMVANRVLVQLRAADSIDDILARRLASISHQPSTPSTMTRVLSYEKINDEGLYIFTLHEATLEGVPTLVSDLQLNAPEVAFAEPDFLVHTTVNPNDPSFYSQWGLDNSGQSGGTPGADIEVLSAWHVRTSAADIIVAVTDTGIRYSHEDLRNNMWVNVDEIAGDFVDNDGNGVVDDVYGFNAYADSGDPYDLDGHGTHVAGIIGAEGNNGLGVSGVAWDVQLMAAKFLHDGTGTTSDAIQVIDYAVANGAHIINASWGGGGYSSSLYNSIGRAHAAGVIFVAAAGNNGYDSDSYPHYPSAYNLPNIVSVASSTRTEALSSFSNYGVNTVDIAAPGSAIVSTYDASDSSYASMSGTSMAAPCVTGILALLMAEFADENHLQLIDRLYGSCEQLPAYADKVRTGGRVNVRQALDIPAGVAPASILVGLHDQIVANGSGFTLRVQAQGTEPLKYTWKLNGQVIAGATEAELSVADAGPESAGAYQITVANDFGSATTEGTIQVLSGLEQIGVALDRPQTTWSLAGNAIWRIQREAKIEGDSAFQSGLIAHDQYTETSTWVEGPGMVTFQWKISSETFFDYFYFVVDNTVVNAMSGEVDWHQAEYHIPAGRHLLRWIYDKDYSVSGHDDAAYLDKFMFVPDWVEEPTLLTQPDSEVSGSTGETLSLEVAASGTGSLYYQWYREGVALLGQTQATITFDPLTASDAGVYQLWVDNGYSRVASQEVLLSVTTHDSAPTITLQPQNVVAEQGNNVSFTVSAAGGEPICFQWMRDGEPLLGQTKNVLQIQNIDFGDAGSYWVLVTNAYGAAQSISASLSVNECQHNISTALDCGMEEWVCSGDSSWYCQSDVVSSGGSALVAGNIGDGESTAVQSTVVGPGTLYFSWKVSSEEHFDYLSFYRNKNLVSGISGEVDWTHVALDLGAGNHMLTWVFAKDGAYGSGYDTAWLDRIVFAPGVAGAPWVFAHPVGAQVELGAGVELSADAVGQGTLNFQWYKDGQAIAEANELVYLISSWSESDAGSYTLKVTNSQGYATSKEAVMTTAQLGSDDAHFSEAIGRGWIYIEGLGYLQPDAFPWVYHAEHGWWYIVVAGGGEYWIYDLQLGWIWTSQAIDAYFWDHIAAIWIFYGGSDGTERWFMNLVNQNWTSEALSGY